MKGSTIENLLFGGIFLGVLAVYFLTLCPSIYWGDSGEFVTVVHTLSIPHPTGYPLYCLVGKLFDLIALGSPAWRVNLFSAVAGSLAIAVVFLVIKASFFSASQRQSKSLFAASWAACCLAVTRMYWSQAIIAEVYALNMLLVGALILVAFRAWSKPSKGLEIAFGLLSGLCLAHHVQSVFIIAPLGLLLAVQIGFRPGWFTRWLRIGVFVVLPLTLYLYLPIRSRANPPIDWGNPETLGNFLWMISGGQFRMFLWKGLTGSTPLLTYWSRMSAFYLVQFWTQWHVLSLLALVGIRRLWNRDPAPCLALLVAWALLVFHALNYQVGDLEVYFLPTYLIAVIFMAHGLFETLQWLSQRASASYMKALNAAVLLVPLALLTANLPHVNLAGFSAAEDYGASVFEAVQPPALIITHSDNDIYPLWYQKFVWAMGQDVAVAGANFLSSPWYEPMLQREGIHATLPSEIYRSKQEWMQAVWRILIRPTIEDRRIYSTRPLVYDQLSFYAPVSMIPGFTWSPCYLIHLHSALSPPREIPVKMNYGHVSERYVHYLPLPFLYQMSHMPMDMEGYTRADFGVWTLTEAAQ